MRKPDKRTTKNICFTFDIAAVESHYSSTSSSTISLLMLISLAVPFVTCLLGAVNEEY